MLRRAVMTLWRSFLVPVLALAAWQGAASLGWVDEVFIPPPTRIAGALADLVATGSLLGAAAQTGIRVVIGLTVTIVLGVTIGLLIASSREFDDLSRPVREFFRALPTVAVIPALLLILGIGDALPIAAIVFAAIWPILLNTVYGIREIDPTLLNVARVHRMGPLRSALKIRLPAALSPIVTGIRISLAIALVIALVTEMITSHGGLGAMVVEARSRFRSADVFAIVVVIGAIGWAANAAAAWVEERTTKVST